MRSIARIVLIATACVVVAPRAYADNASEAQLQYDLGTELFHQHRYGEALERFLASNRLVPNRNVMFNIAQIEELLRRWVDAYNWYETVLHASGDEATARRATDARDRLAPQVAVLDVTTDPPGAELFVDREDLGSVGIAPRRVAVTDGAHQVLARATGRRSTSASAGTTTGHVAAVNLVLPAVTGTLVVETPRPGATVARQDGAVLGTTPLRMDLPVGALALVVSQPGYVDQPRSVDVRDGATTRIAIAMTRAAAHVAVLSVRGAPVGAQVTLGGHALGTVPLSVGDLDPGTARLEVREGDREPVSLQIPLEPGAATRVDVTLFRREQRAWNTWRWAGYSLGGGALVGFGIVGAVALSGHAAFLDAPSRAQYDTVGTLSGVADGLLIAGVAVAATTFVLDLLLPHPPRSHARVTMHR